MRVALIGGTGLLGRQIAARLEREGHEVMAVARHTGPAHATPSGGFRAADCKRLDQLEAALDGAEAVVSAFGGLRQEPGQTFHDVNFKGMQHLIAACRSRRVRRVVHVSALGARPSSRSVFGRTKHAGEELLRRSLLDVTVLRPSAMFGAGDAFVTPLAALLRRFPVAPLPGPGTARLQPIAVEDVAQSVTTALARPGTVGQAYDLPGIELLTITEVYDRVLQAVGLNRPKVHVPYLLIEPLSHLIDEVPGVHFTFDQLAILEEERPGDPRPTATEFGLTLERFSTEAIRRILRNAA